MVAQVDAGGPAPPPKRGPPKAKPLAPSDGQCCKFSKRSC